MKKYFYYQIVIFLVVSVSGIILSFLLHSKEDQHLKLVVEASDSLRQRAKLKEEVLDLEKVAKSQEGGLEEKLLRIENRLRRCKRCHDVEHKEKVKEIEKTFAILKRLSPGSSSFDATLGRLKKITEEASVQGEELIEKRLAMARKISVTGWIFLGIALSGLFVVILLFAIVINQRAKKYIDNVVQATVSVAEGRDVMPEKFKDEFSPIGRALEHLQRELKVKEEKLRNWAEQWQNTFDTVSEMMAICDTSGIIILSNKAFKNQFGQDVEGINIYNVICKNNTGKEDCALYKSITTGGDYTDELLTEGKIIAVNTYPLKNNNGEITGGIWVGRDITKERELEERALHSEKMVALGELVSGIAHEINNPLSVVVGYTELLIMKKELPDEYKKHVEKIYESAIRASNIIKSLLDFSRRKPPELVPCNINEVVDRIIDLTFYELKSDGIEVIKQYQDVNYVKGDPTQLGQIVLNIIKNAHDAILQNDHKRRLTIKTFNKNSTVCLQISDTGGGIPEKYKNRIFEPFFTTKEIGKGTGLGLSITYSLVKAHGGEIDVMNNEEGGATFTVCLPAIEEPPE